MGEAHSPTVTPAPPASAGEGAISRAQLEHAEQVRELYRFCLPAAAGLLAAAALAFAALWGVASALALALWAGAAFGIAAWAFLLRRAYRLRQPPPDESRRWGIRIVFVVAAAGALWGVLGSALYPSGALAHEFLVAAIVGGAAVAAALALAPLKGAYAAFAVPALLPLIPAVFAQGTMPHFYLGVLLLVFLVVMLGVGSLVSGVMRKAIGAKFEQRELAALLVKTQADSRTAKLQLNEQVYAQRVTGEELRQASQKLMALIEASPVAIVVCDVEGRVESWNRAAVNMFGWTQEEARHCQGPLCLPGREGEADELRRRILNGESVADLEAMRLRKDGTKINVSVSASLVRDVAGRPAGYLTMFADITARKRAEKQQKVTSQLTMLLTEAQSVEDAMPRVIEAACRAFGFVYGACWVLDRQNQILRCAETWARPGAGLDDFREHSKARLERPGQTPGALIPRIWATGAPVWLEDIGAEPSFARRKVALQAGLHSAFGFPITVGGEVHGVLEFFATEPRAPDQAALAVAKTMSAHIGQFIARAQAERNLQFVASHDALTGLFNRSMFSERLQQALAQAYRHGRQLAVLFIDLDGFKLVNDLHGHAAGDTVLADLAGRLRECLREGDTLGRMGGDEFVVLIEGYTEDVQLLDVARKVLDTVAQPFVLHTAAHNLTASIGISTYPQDGTNAPDLLRNSDVAMYRAKEQGKNNFQFYSPEMNTHLVERVNLETALRRALERNELALFYQPRVSVAENRVTGVEGLLRWMHPAQGLLNPPAFISIAEDAGLINPIGVWIFHAACAQLKLWHQRGVAGLCMAVNLSPRQFAQDNLIEALREAVHEAGIDPRHLEIEVTESALMGHPERAAKLLGEVKELGARIVVDDFGIGYSSLGMLSRFPVDAVKIDRSLVAQLPGAAGAAAMARAVIAMAHSLGLQVTAEGVESRAQWDFLAGHGCDAIQGNYYCAPAPADTVTSMLLQQAQGVARVVNVQQFRPWRAPPQSGERDPES